MKRFQKGDITNKHHIINRKVDMMGIWHTKHKNYALEGKHAGNRLTKDRQNKLEKQTEFYNKLNNSEEIKTMPFLTGRFLIRKHNHLVKKLGNCWYEQAEEWTHRDQVSWQYAFHTEGFGKISLDLIKDQNIINNRDLAPVKHLK